MKIFDGSQRFVAKGDQGRNGIDDTALNTFYDPTIDKGRRPEVVSI
jgi:hypothetical protein